MLNNDKDVTLFNKESIITQFDSKYLKLYAYINLKFSIPIRVELLYSKNLLLEFLLVDHPYFQWDLFLSTFFQIVLLMINKSFMTTIYYQYIHLT